MKDFACANLYLCWRLRLHVHERLQYVLSFSLFHSRRIPRSQNNLPLCGKPWPSARTAISLPALHSLRSLCSPYSSFRCLTSHPLLPHSPRSACCVLLTLASSAWTTKDVLRSPPPSPPFSGFLLHERNDNVREEQLIRHITPMTGGSVWNKPIRCTQALDSFSFALKYQSIPGVSGIC